jgi:hydrogenase maturation factor HypF (carbamoyltransferase family)
MSDKKLTLEEVLTKLFPDIQVIEIDPGDSVLCDLCNEEYKDSDAKGGILFSSNAACPKCAPRLEDSAIEHRETHYIHARAKPNETFRDFVYRIRESRK